MSELEQLEASLSRQIKAASEEATLEQVRISAFGKKGTVAQRLKMLGKMSPQQRQEMGPVLNGLKSRLLEAFSIRQGQLREKALNARLACETVDVSLPVGPDPLLEGRIHPVTQVIDEIITIFADLGFSVADGPDIETDYYNFTALNFPENHPAREMHDTFFFPEKETGERLLLRTHTSPVQIHTMEANDPPIRVIIPGRTYRQDSDQTHTPMFHQVEGLVIGEDIHLGHLKWTLETFCKAFFEVSALKMRLRPSFFPFTEPSMEVDVQCRFGAGDVKIGEGEDWMEILGAGMVHPNVLKHGGVDPLRFSGFAFGVGIDRLAMLKYGAPDLRAFFDADVRWIKHYGFRPMDIPSLFGGLSS